MVNVEVQKRNDKDHVRRVRFNSAIVTTNITDPGTKFENVPDLIIIYVTEFDIFNKGQVKYVVDSVLRGYGDIVNDGVVRIFINCANKDETKVSKLMTVFRGDVTYRKEFSKTNEIIKKYTEKEEGISQMSNFVQELFGEELQKERENMRKFYEDKIADMKKQYDEQFEDMRKQYEDRRKQYEDMRKQYEDAAKNEKYMFAIADMLKNNCSIDDIRNFILSYQ